MRPSDVLIKNDEQNDHPKAKYDVIADSCSF